VTTVVFADIVGSTGIYESLGDAAASRFVSQLITTLSKSFESRQGRVVKMLGDGLFVVFPGEADALAACVAIQQHLQDTPVYPSGDASMDSAAVQLQFGMESGDLVEIDGDCFGEAVNSAARLAELAGGAQILTTARVRSALPSGLKNLLHGLGPLFLRGKTDATEVYRVQWHDENDNEVTVMGAVKAAPALSGRLSLSLSPFHGASRRQAIILESPRGSANVGRALPIMEGLGTAQPLVVSDARVSRLHCSVAWRGTHWVLVDVSSFGTWVYAGEQTKAVALRRGECQLVGSGYISLGCERTADAAPLLRYQSL
jgi:adenylate cyclase